MDEEREPPTPSPRKRKDFHRMKIKISSPKASSRTLATGLHVLRPSGAARPRGRSALVVLRRETEQKETLTPRGVRASRKEGWIEVPDGPLTPKGGRHPFCQKGVVNLMVYPVGATTVSFFYRHCPVGNTSLYIASWS